MAKRENKKLEWYVFYQDTNSGELVYSNVLGESFVEYIQERLKSKKKNWAINNYEDLREAINGEFMYHYWGRTEYELIVKNWAGKELEKKIDVYFQLKPNIDVITHYVIKELNIKFKA